MSHILNPFRFAGSLVIQGSGVIADAGANHLTWTPGVTGDSRTEMSAEAVFKLHGLVTDGHIFAASDGAGNNVERIYIDATGNIHYEIFVGGVTVVHYEFSGVLLDFNAWYQLVIIRNGNTITLYLNGAVLADFDTSDAPTGDNGMFGHTEVHAIGKKPWAASGYLNMSFARVTYQDGVVAVIGDYGSEDGNGGWVLADVSGLTYGTGGICFEGGTSVSTGAESYGSSQTVTKTGTITSVNDSPTDDANNGIGNYCLWNPLDVHVSYIPTFANGNKDGTGGAATAYTQIRGTVGASSGKKVFELTPGTTLTNGALAGIIRASDLQNAPSGATSTKGILARSDNGGQIYNDGTAIESAIGTWANGDVMRCEVDFDAGTVDFFKNGTAWGSQVTGLTLNTEPWVPTWVPFGTYKGTLECGQSGFVGTPTSDYLEWHTGNLPAPTVAKPDDEFTVNLTTHNGTSDTVIAPSSFAVDDYLVISKNRDTAEKWYWSDGLRGYTKYLESNDATTETTDANVHSVSGDTLTLGSTFAADDYVTYLIKAGAAGGVSNTDGSETVTTSVAGHNGFSIISFTTPASGVFTIGHGMGQAPDLIIVKPYSAANGWLVGMWDVLGVDGHLELHTTATVSNPADDAWNDTVPTSSVITGKTNHWSASGSCVVYAFAKTPGLIGIGSYVGNGNVNGPYVIVDDGANGFRPAFTLVKKIGVDQWSVLDAGRDVHNPVGRHLPMDDTSAETAAGAIPMDYTANGFKVRLSSSTLNTNGITYLYLAFAENPFGGDGVAQARAR